MKRAIRPRRRGFSSRYTKRYVRRCAPIVKRRRDVLAISPRVRRRFGDLFPLSANRAAALYNEFRGPNIYRDQLQPISYESQKDFETRYGALTLTTL